MSAHKIEWWAYTYDSAGNEHLIRRNNWMRGPWGYDVVCSCGWKTTTGGAIRAYIQKEVRRHKIEEGA